MAGVLAEEDDDDGFGDFKFVSTTMTPPNPPAALNGAPDDFWSDFVSFNGSPHGETNSKPPTVGNSLEQFDFLADRPSAGRSAETSAAGDAPEKPKWVKPSGAIPLSLFGEEEEEEEAEEGSGVVDPSFNGPLGLFNHSNGDPGKKAPNLSSPVALDDLIANLYNNNASRVADGSGMNTSSNGGKLQELGAVVEIQAELNPVTIQNGFDSNTSSRNAEQDDEDEWEFRAADAEARLEDDNLKGEHSKGESASNLNFNKSFPSWNGFSSNLNGFSSKTNGLELGTNGFDLTDIDKQEDVDDDLSWEFKGADMENKLKEEKLKVEGSMTNLFEDFQPTFKFGNVMQEPTVVNVATDKNSQIFGLDFAYDLNPKSGSKSSTPLDSNITSKGTDAENGINANPVFGTFSLDDAWEFKETPLETGPLSQNDPVVTNSGNKATSAGSDDAVLQTVLHYEEDPKAINGFSPAPVNGNVGSVDDLWGFKDAFTESNLKQEIIEGNRGSGKEADLHSMFGDGKFESEATFADPKLPTSKPSNDTSIIRQPSNMSIDDLIASLYNQAAPIASVPDVQISGEIGFDTLETALEEEPENEIDDFDDSWDFKTAEAEKRDAAETSVNFMQHLSVEELAANPSGQESTLMNSVDISHDSSREFKDASTRLGYGDHVSLPSLEEPTLKFLANVENDLLEFYSKLKDELCLIVLSHLHRMKEEQGLSGLLGEDAKLKAQHEEIQVLYNELTPDNSIPEGPSSDLSMRVGHLKGFLPVLGEKFQALEAEYQLSRKLLLAEEDPGSLIELLKHVSSKLKILRWGSLEDHVRYVSTWSKLIALCLKELKHGALLWKQVLDKDLQGQLLAKSEGKNYLLALGEICRAVGVLGASVKMYKPWLLSSPAEFVATSRMLNECSLYWSSSGLEEALRSMTDPLEIPYVESVAALLESIKRIHGLDEHALQTHNYTREERICRLSLLNTVLVRDMKMIEWEGGEYFLKLANLWANLVSRNPPDLPPFEIS